MANKCTWCSSIGTMSKHPDKDRAKEGITRCSACNMCHSPNATSKRFLCLLGWFKDYNRDTKYG